MIFGCVEELSTKEVILKEELFTLAKRLHAHYDEKYKIGPWETLDSFKRYSNVSAADFAFTLEKLSNSSNIDLLTELEHIRWCRYHYLNNWTYSDVRNDLIKRHNLLKPFADLTEADKQKDRNNVEILLSLKN
jgi:hypothetical protein